MNNMAKKKAKNTAAIKGKRQRELFAQFFVAGKSKTDAHELAGYSAKTRKARSNEASRLSHTPEVAARIAELKAEVAEEFRYTREQAMKELETAQKIAMGAPVPMPDGTTKELATPNPAAMITAIKQKIDLTGIEPAKKIDVNLVEAMTYTIEKEK